MRKKKKVLIAIPTRDSNALIPASLSMSLHRIQPTKRHSLGLHYSYAQPVDANRNRIIEHFLSLDKDYEWLLMIDDDCPVPDNVLDMLYKGKKIVSGVIFTMKNGVPYPIIMKDDKDGFYSLMTGKEILAQKGSLVKVDGTGMGCMAIHRSVLNKMKKPWFKFEYTDTGDIRLGEDYWFCEKAKKLGYDIYVDTDVHVGHIKALDLRAINKIIGRVVDKYTKAKEE